jgi:DNA-binding MarR family transcriptional regulator
VHYLFDVQRAPGRGASGSRGTGSVAFLLAQVGAHAAARFAERLAPLKLAPQHAGILRVIGTSAGLSQRALGERLGVLPSRLVALVDELETRGLVERRDDPQDRRTYALHLTEKGRAMLEEIGRAAREHQESLCAALGEPDRQVLAALLARIAEEQGLTAGVHPGFKTL